MSTGRPESWRASYDLAALALYRGMGGDSPHISRPMTVLDQISLKGKTAIVTGGEGLMGRMMCETIRELGGTPYSLDINGSPDIYGDVADRQAMFYMTHTRFEKIDILINNAVGNQKAVPKYDDGWAEDMRVGLYGCLNMIRSCEDGLKAANGVVLNIGSDMSLIPPDQSLYPEGMVKPLSYSVIKHGMLGMTRYFAQLWGGQVRVNLLCPGGVDVGQKVPRCPMNRLANIEEMKGPVAFLISPLSAYMTGAFLAVDGGRTAI